MPHATGSAYAANDEDDDALISRVLNTGDPTDLQNGLDLQRDLEPGEKADDAVDFGDLSDDDLADDEDIRDAQVFQERQSHQDDNTPDGLEAFMQDQDLPSFANGDKIEDDGMDDLFGDNASSPLDTSGRTGHIEDDLDDPDFIFGNDNEGSQAASALRPTVVPFDSHKQHSRQHVSNEYQDAPLSREQQLQLELFQMSRAGQEALPAPPENQEELLASLWPKFKSDTIPKFIDLLPPKKARYVGKTIPKPPKSVHPTKLSLELAQDEERSFKTWQYSKNRGIEDIQDPGSITIEQNPIDENMSEDYVDTDSDFESSAVGGISWQDLQIACEDWDDASDAHSFESQESEQHSTVSASKNALEDIDHYGNIKGGCSPTKVSEDACSMKYANINQRSEN